MAEPTPTIYSYYTPEVLTVVRNALATLNSKGGIHTLLQQNYHPGLDKLHEPLLSKYEQFARSEGVIGLDTFDHKYFTNGSSEGIFHLVASLLPGEQLYQFEGEYQGYEAYANSIGRTVVTVKSTGELMSLKPGLLIVSNPSSKNGNCINGLLLKEWGKRHRIILDLAYMGMTQEPLNLDLTDDSIVAVVGSLSKPFGMYYYRIGFCYSVFPLVSLNGNKWFKNALSIKLGEAVLDHFSDPKNFTRFKNSRFVAQTAATEEASLFLGRSLTESDVWLLATGGPYIGSIAKVDPFRRGDKEGDFVVRVCLTPYYMEYES